MRDKFFRHYGLRYGLYPFLMVFLVFVFTCNALAQPAYDYCKQASSMVGTIQKFHYNPQALEDEFSEKVFDDFFMMLDPHARFFTEENISSLGHFRKKLDDEIKHRNCSFINHAIEMYRNRLLLADSLVDVVLENPLDFSTEDHIEFGLHNEKTKFAADDRTMAKRWGKWLKYQMLAYVFSQEDETTLASISNGDYLANEAEVREKIRQREKCRIDKILNHPMGFEKYVASQWLKAIALAFDPHTDFFSAYDIRLFEASVSKDALTYGIHIEESNSGDIIISSIVPGSPAWNANELHKGDIILKLETSDEKSHDFMCMDIFEAYESLHATDEQEIRLVIKKPNGQIRAVSLRKEKMEMEENIVQSFILTGEKKIGYISLPAFYTQLENDDAVGCANDVAREIIKMKRENIEGLILDIRFNGGGSMKEALELVGLFIDYGPVTVAMNKDNNPVVMRDMNRGAVYMGPMVVMVNSMSASASEIFAAALQDYNRAVIVGDVTYGKATGQIVLPVEGVNGVPQAMSGEFVKVTVEKFFRLNGKTHQMTGVVPDILLPDYFSNFPITERHKLNSLSYDSISKKTYFQPLKPLPIKSLKEKSISRISNDENFKAVLALTGSDYQRMQFRLQPELFKQDFSKYSQWIQGLDDSSNRSSTSFQVKNIGFNENHINMNPFKSDYIKTLADEIQNSIYIEEAYHITKDLIKLIKK
jgi:carboxyl-terminal processing protease